MYVKYISDVFRHSPTSKKIFILDQSLNEIAEGEIIDRNQWIKVSSKKMLTGINTTGTLTIRTNDYTGDLIIDHVLIVESILANQCNRNIQLNYV